MALFQRRFDGLLEHFKGLCTDYRLTVDEKRWSALDTKRLSGLGVFPYQGSVFSRIETLIKHLSIKTDFLGKPLQVVFAERALIFTRLTVI